MLPSARQNLSRTGTRALDALHRHPLLWALLLATVATAVLLLALTPRFETNDDIGMQSVANGTLTGEPQPDLIVTNVIVGLVLAGLYRAAEGLPWYGAYLFLLQFIALAALTYVVLAGRREGLAGRLLLLTGVVALFHLPLWLGLQFTSTAILLGATGVVLFRSVADRAHFPWAPIAGAAAMVALSWWIRWRSGAAVVLLGAVFLAPALRRANWRRFAAFAGITLVLLAAGWVTQAAYYGGRAEWQDYFAFTEVRGQLHQSRHLLEVDPAVLAEVGWTQNDLLMFDNWFLSDEATYQTEDLEAIAAAVPHPFEADEGLVLLRDQAAGWDGAFRVALAATLGGLVWVQGDHRNAGRSPSAFRPPPAPPSSSPPPPSSPTGWRCPCSPLWPHSSSARSPAPILPRRRREVAAAPFGARRPPPWPPAPWSSGRSPRCRRAGATTPRPRSAAAS
jgi:hypothetical protein